MNTKIKCTLMMGLTLMMGACGRLEKKKGTDSGGSASATTQETVAPAPAANAGALTLDLSGAVGLAVSTKSGASLTDDANGNLLKVNADGSLSPALRGSGVQVQHVYHDAPSKTTFLVFAEPTTALATAPAAGLSLTGDSGNIADRNTHIFTCWNGEKHPFTSIADIICPSKPKCVFGYAGADGIVRCVDFDLSSVEWAVNEPIQLDGRGNIYYQGGNTDPNAWGGAVFRKFSKNSKPTDVVAGGAAVYSVEANGDVLYTSALPGELGIRKLNSDGTRKNVASGNVGWIYKFPDGNTYINQTQTLSYGETVGRIVDGVLDPKPFVAPLDPATTTPDMLKGVSACSADRIHTTTSKKVVGLATGIALCLPTIIQYFPEYKVFPLTMIHELMGQGPGNTSTETMVYGSNNDGLFVVAGHDSTGGDRLISFDVDSGKETDLLGSEDIRTYAASIIGNTVFFSGLDMNTNQQVTGIIDLTTLKVSKTPSAVTVSEIHSI